MHVPPRPGARSPTTHAGSHAAGDVPQLQVAIVLAGRGPGAAGIAEDAGTSREGDALLHEGIRSEPRG